MNKNKISLCCKPCRNTLINTVLSVNLADCGDNEYICIDFVTS